MLDDRDIERIADAVTVRRAPHFDVEQIRKVVAAELDSRRTIDIETHRSHHAYVSQLIERDKRRVERYEAIWRHVLGWGVVGGILFLGYRLGDGMVRWLRGLVQ